MTVKLLTEYHLEFLSLTRGCIVSPESTLVQMPHCLRSHVAACIILTICGILFMHCFFLLAWLGTMLSKLGLLKLTVPCEIGDLHKIITKLYN